MLVTELTGTLGADAEVKEINGEEYATFSVATTPDYSKKDETVWVQAMIRGVGRVQYLTKGTRVFIRGRLRLSAWTNKQGEPQAGISVFTTEIEFLGGGERQQEDSQPKYKTNKKRDYSPF